MIVYFFYAKVSNDCVNVKVFQDEFLSPTLRKDWDGTMWTFFAI